MKKFFFLFPLMLLVFSTFAYAKVQSAKLSVDVPSGRWKSILLKNLPKSSVVKAEIKSDGPIIVTFVDETKYEKFPDIERPLFQGNVRDKITFSVEIPTTGHYYLVFNNIFQNSGLHVWDKYCLPSLEPVRIFRPSDDVTGPFYGEWMAVTLKGLGHKLV